MNYEKINTLQIDDCTKVFVKSRGNYIFNIGVIVDSYSAFKNKTLIKQLIEQINEEAIDGFFYFADDKLIYRSIVKEKSSSLMLYKFINNAIASVTSFLELLEVLNCER